MSTLSLSEPASTAAVATLGPGAIGAADAEIEVAPPTTAPAAASPGAARHATLDRPVESRSHTGVYVPVSWKLGLALFFSFAWLGISIWIALPWIADIGLVTGAAGAWAIVLGIALLPGLANSFVLGGLLLDRRPVFEPVLQLPPITVLVAAYNEEDCIEETLASLTRQKYGGPVQILVIDDGSSDATATRVQAYGQAGAFPAGFEIRLIQMPRNGGKARALNAGLAQAAHDLVVTVDADTTLFRGALANLVINQLQSPPSTAATAGTVLVRNSRANFITRLQEWDYFLGIAVVKRIQSLFQGTMVAQGAFSIYRKDVLLAQGGWEETVGEDIVLTWAMLEDGHRVGYAENAFVFTNVPESYGAYYRQRKRWARGVIEAFKRCPRVLLKSRMNLPFIYLNVAFPLLDFAYLFVFVPGLIAALLFQSYLIVGVLTLLLIPLAVLVNAIMFFKQRAIFRRYGLRVRRNLLGVIFFTLMYQLLLSPASLVGYASELFNRRKTW